MVAFLSVSLYRVSSRACSDPTAVTDSFKACVTQIRFSVAEEIEVCAH